MRGMYCTNLAYENITPEVHPVGDLGGAIKVTMAAEASGTNRAAHSPPASPITAERSASCPLDSSPARRLHEKLGRQLTTADDYAAALPSAAQMLRYGLQDRHLVRLMTPPSTGKTAQQLFQRPSSNAQRHVYKSSSLPASASLCADVIAAQAGADHMISAHPPCLQRYLEMVTPEPEDLSGSSDELHTKLGNAAGVELSPVASPAGAMQRCSKRQQEMRHSAAFSGVSRASASWEFTAKRLEGSSEEPSPQPQQAPAPKFAAGCYTQGHKAVSPQDAIAAAVRSARPASAGGQHVASASDGLLQPPSPGLAQSVSRASELSWRLSAASPAPSQLQLPDGASAAASPSQESSAAPPRAGPLFADPAPDVRLSTEHVPLRLRYSAVEVVPADDPIVDVSYVREEAAGHVPLRRRFGVPWNAHGVDDSVDTRRCVQLAVFRSTWRTVTPGR
jgi:hypothetical protein